MCTYGIVLIRNKKQLYGGTHAHINYTIEFTECKKNSHLSLHEMSLIQAWKLDGHQQQRNSKKAK